MGNMSVLIFRPHLGIPYGILRLRLLRFRAVSVVCAVFWDPSRFLGNHLEGLRELDDRTYAAGVGPHTITGSFIIDADVTRIVPDELPCSARRCLICRGRCNFKPVSTAFSSLTLPR